MDEALDVAELVVDLGFENAFAWLLRIVGFLAILGGLGLWLLTDTGLLVLPAALMGVGLVLLVVPSVLLFLVELT